MVRTSAGLVFAAVMFSALPAMAQDRTTDSAVFQTAAAPAAAQPSPDPAPAPKPVTLTVGADFPTAYMFRGIFQEDKGFIMQPFVDVGIAAAPGVTINAGLWNSVHSGPSGSDNEDGRGAWYEMDFYASATFQAGKFKPGVLYTAYTSPNDAFNTVHELAAVIAYDDSASTVPLNPKAILAFELDGQADGGESKGTYLELGVRPVLPLGAHPQYPVTLAIPAKLGLGVKDYYESFDGNKPFGYFDLGGILSVPLAFMNGKTTWEIHGGVDILWLGETTKAFNGGDGVKAVGVIGFSMIY